MAASDQDRFKDRAGGLAVPPRAAHRADSLLRVGDGPATGSAASTSRERQSAPNLMSTSRHQLLDLEDAMPERYRVLIPFSPTPGSG